MSFTTIGKHRIAYRLKKAGPQSLVFIHGLGASGNSFARCFAMEAFRDFTAAAVDLPGCGESSWAADFSYSIKDQAEVVLRWVRNLELTRIILVGHSMGGAICLYVAEALGEQVAGFFSLEGNLSREDCFFSGKIASASQSDFEKQGIQEFRDAVKASLEEAPSPGLVNYYENISKAYPRAIYLSSVSLVQESCEGHLSQRFATLATRKWYVFGERSTSPATKKFLEKSNIPYFVVPESGHFMMDDQPDLFYRMLFNVLQDSK
jgi:pimeloyl-ACP methyl ester carboxylesterase